LALMPPAGGKASLCSLIPSRISTSLRPCMVWARRQST
jgi:hypothetical protein